MKQLTRRSHPPRIRGFTLVEIMIVVAIIALLAAIAIPGLLRARKRAQGVSIVEDLRQIDSATDQYALEFNIAGNATITPAAWQLYVQPGSRLYTTNADIYGDNYGNQVVGLLPLVPSYAWRNLSDVCNSSFWSPFTESP
jgi:prepilin-type N-terminal cleavage/methylation domain-containing protein